MFHRNQKNRVFCKDIFGSIDRSLRPTGGIQFFWEDCYVLGTQNKEVTKLLDVTEIMMQIDNLPLPPPPPPKGYIGSIPPSRPSESSSLAYDLYAF